MKRTIFLWLGALSIAIATPASAQDGRPASVPEGVTALTITQPQIQGIDDLPTLYRLAGTYQQGSDMTRLSWTLEQLARMLPMSGEVRLALASAYSNLDEKSKAYDTLLRMQQQGFGYNLTDDPRFSKVTGTEVWSYTVANLRANLKPFGEGKTAFQLPKGEYLFESMAWDPKRERFLVGSVREGKIYLADKNGKIDEFIGPTDENKLWSVYALATDPQRDLLYVATTASAYFKGFKAEDMGQAGVLRFRLSTGQLIDRVLLPKAVADSNSITALAVSSKGDVYAADGLHNTIYRLDGKTLKPIVRNPKLTSLRGMTVSGDGKFLYFADFALGLFGVDLSTGKGFDVRFDLNKLVLPGIESLYWYDGTLIAIEPGMAPPRVIRLHMSADGRKIERFMALDAANPAFSFPTNGALVGDQIYFLADSRRDFYDQYGVARNDYAASPQHVFRSDLRFAWKETLARPAFGQPDAPSGQKILGQLPVGKDPRSLIGDGKNEDFGRPKAPVKKPEAPAKKD